MEWEGVNETTPPKKKEVSSDDLVSDDVSIAGSVSSRASTSTQNKSLETKKEDPTKSLRQRSIRFLLPLLKFSIKHLRIAVFGTDARMVIDYRKRFSPRKANQLIAEK